MYMQNLTDEECGIRFPLITMFFLILWPVRGDLVRVRLLLSERLCLEFRRTGIRCQRFEGFS